MRPLVVAFPHGLLNTIEKAPHNKGNPHEKKKPAWGWSGHSFPLYWLVCPLSCRSKSLNSHVCGNSSHQVDGMTHDARAET